MNHVTLSGNLVKDPEPTVLNISGKQVTVVKFTVAENRRFKKANGEYDEQTNFIQCEAWDSGADYLVNNFVKGEKILVEGSLRQNSWVDKKTEEKKSMVIIRVEKFEKMGKFEKKVQKDEVPPKEEEKDDESSGAPGEDIPF